MGIGPVEKAQGMRCYQVGNGRIRKRGAGRKHGGTRAFPDNVTKQRWPSIVCLGIPKDEWWEVLKVNGNHIRNWNLILAGNRKACN